MLYKSGFKSSAFLIAVSLFLLTISCNRNSSNGNSLSDPDDNGGYASDLSRAEWINNDVIDIADAAGTFYNGTQLRSSARTTLLGTCATVATDTSTLNTPHVIIVRFGDPGASDSGCLCLDGRKRKGSILISYNGSYSDSGQLHTITYDNYYVNGMQVTGSLQVTRKDTTITGNMYYNELVNDTITLSPNQYIIWKGSLVRKWVSGDGTGTRNDDVFSISGNATLTRPNGHFFTCNIATPLQFAISCNYAEAGVVNVNGYSGINTQRVLNYGVGECDTRAQLTIGTIVYQVALQ